MNFTEAFTSGDGTADAVRPPAQCTCTRIAVGTLAETLGCPARWREMPGGIWVHTRPPRRRAASRHRETEPTTRGNRT